MHEAGGVAAFFQDSAIGSMKLKAALAAAGVQVDGRTQLFLIEAFTKYVEVERNTGSIGQANDQIQDNLQAMLQELPFKAVGIADTKQLPAHETGAAELRTEELLHVAAGLPVPGLDLLKDIRFPEQDQGRGSPSARTLVPTPKSDPRHTNDRCLCALLGFWKLSCAPAARDVAARYQLCPNGNGIFPFWLGFNGPHCRFRLA